MAARLRIRRSALAANYQFFKAQNTGPVGAVVKANAYGIGAPLVVETLLASGCTTFFVATAEEGRALRRDFADIVVYVFEGCLEDAASMLLEYRLWPLLNSDRQLDRWQSLGAGQPCGLHVDTGMARLGLDWQRFEADPEGLLATIAALNLKLLATHFACADKPEHPLNQLQCDRFQLVRRCLPEVPVSMGNSAAGAADSVPTDGLLRPGIGLYGGNPFAERANPLQPVVTLEAEVVQCRSLRPGQSAGYGASWVADRDTQLAVLGIGYADGLPRSLSQGATVVVQGQRRPIVGRVSMDLLQIDVTGLIVAEGDWVELFGEQQSLDWMAAQQQTIAYEVLTRLGQRIDRVVVD